MMDGVMGGVMVLMMLLFMLIVAGAVILGGGRVLKDLTGRAAKPSAIGRTPGVETAAGQLSALEQAKERFARGEIDHAELDRLLDVLLRDDHRAGGER